MGRGAPVQQSKVKLATGWRLGSSSLWQTTRSLSDMLEKQVPNFLYHQQLNHRFSGVWEAKRELEGSIVISVRCRLICFISKIGEGGLMSISGLYPPAGG